MTLAQAVFLGILQGLTEFLPVSSTAHLFLAQHFLRVDAEGALAFDIVLHLGTALALVAIFRAELARMITEAGRAVLRRPARFPQERALVVPIVVGTIPGVAAGVLLLKKIESLRSLALVGLSMLVACAYFFLAERIGDAIARRGAERDAVTLADAVWIGLAQAAAGLMAGFSRSGFTIATGRLRGVNREKSARFSFLLALVIILGAGARTILDLRRHPQPALSLAILSAGFAAAAVVGFFAVRFLLTYLKTHSLRPFAIYLGLLGAALLAIGILSPGI